MEKDFYTTKEFAEVYGCSRDRVYEWLRQKIIRCYERPTPHAIYRIPKTELAKLKGEEGAASEQSIVQQPIHKEFDPIIVQRRDQHFIKLGSIAESLLANDLNSVVPRGWTINRDTASGGQNKSLQVRYIITSEGVYSELTNEQLSALLQNNINITMRKDEWFFRDCFIPHLKSELPEELKTELFFKVVEKQPYQLIDTLRVLAARKTFKGICPVCAD